MRAVPRRSRPVGSVGLGAFLAVVVVLLGACSGSEEAGDLRAYCEIAERAIVAQGDPPSEEYLDAVEALSEAEPPPEVADDWAVIESQDDGIENSLIVDNDQYELYQAALDGVNRFLIDDCGFDAAFVNGAP